MRPLRRAGTVIFDCDSTLSAIEGIEALADTHKAEIERLTEAAMGGSIPFEDVYGRRLALVRPTRARVEALAYEYAGALAADARDVLAALRAEGITIGLVSGGLRPAVEGLARELGIDTQNVAAVDIYFDAAGNYAGFDAGSPLWRSGGKAELLGSWRDRLRAPVMLVGDGVTDLEARPVIDVFIAFTGFVERPAVVTGADIVVRGRSLAPILPLALGGQPPSDHAALSLYRKGLGLLDPEIQARLSRAFNAER
ncbi:MAG: HAD-IB family phosphatase [Longimicrobiales bacterium]